MLARVLAQTQTAVLEQTVGQIQPLSEPKRYTQTMLNEKKLLH